MAVAYIAEFADLPIINGLLVAAPKMPPVAEQTVAIGVAAQSAAFNAKTKFVRINVDAVCSLEFGPNPTATMTSPRMSANTTEFFGVNANDKVSVIANT